MQAFLQIALGFPTFIFGVLLLVMLLYWLIALAGMLALGSAAAMAQALAPAMTEKLPTPGGCAASSCRVSE